MQRKRSPACSGTSAACATPNGLPFVQRLQPGELVDVLEDEIVAPPDDLLALGRGRPGRRARPRTPWVPSARAVELLRLLRRCGRGSNPQSLKLGNLDTSCRTWCRPTARRRSSGRRAPMEALAILVEGRSRRTLFAWESSGAAVRIAASEHAAAHVYVVDLHHRTSNVTNWECEAGGNCIPGLLDGSFSSCCGAVGERDGR